MAQISYKWVIVSSKIGVVKIAGSETPSGTEYIVTNSGCPVRSDDLDYVLNKEIEFCCPHNGKMIKPVKKGLVPAGIKLPEPFIEKSVVKEPDPEPEVEVVEPYASEMLDESDGQFTRRKRNKQD